MLVYLFRHGEAEAKAKTDAERVLTRNGVLESRDVAAKFLARAPLIDKAMMSPLERARQTAATLRAGFTTLRFEINDLLKPDGDVYKLLDAVGNSRVQHLLLVGHNPCLTSLMSLMLDGITETGRNMGTSELVCISLEEAIPGFGELLYTITPTRQA
ncbi:MAG: Phosphohistidine phosphatase [Pseudomonadota bacterium]|jgi:phosphohistidine phosphatase